MGLFGGGNSTNESTTSVDNSVEQNDFSTNTNNAGATQVGGNLTITDGGAFDVAQGALDGAFEFGSNALDVSNNTFQSATDLVKDVNQSSLDFGQSSMDSAVDAIESSNDHARQLIGQTIDKSLAVASAATQSDSTNTMQSITKIGIALAVVFGVGFVAMGMKK